MTGVPTSSAALVGLRPEPVPVSAIRRPSTDAVGPDTFNGDTAHLRQSIEALIALDAEGALVPHGIGGHARTLLTAAYHRLAD